ncbi:hypothetical protein EON82_25515, partial [bacterium]
MKAGATWSVPSWEMSLTASVSGSASAGAIYGGGGTFRSNYCVDAINPTPKVGIWLESTDSNETDAEVDVIIPALGIEETYPGLDVTVRLNDLRLYARYDGWTMFVGSVTVIAGDAHEFDGPWQIDVGRKGNDSIPLFGIAPVLEVGASTGPLPTSGPRSAGSGPDIFLSSASAAASATGSYSHIYQGEGSPGLTTTDSGSVSASHYNSRDTYQIDTTGDSVFVLPSLAHGVKRMAPSEHREVIIRGGMPKIERVVTTIAPHNPVIAEPDETIVVTEILPEEGLMMFVAGPTAHPIGERPFSEVATSLRESGESHDHGGIGFQTVWSVSS